MAKNVDIVIGAKDKASAVLGKVSQSMGRMRRQADGGSDALARFAKRAIAAVAAVKGMQIIGGLPGKFARTTAEIGKLSVQTGETVENLSALRFASRSLSVDFDDVVGSIEELNIRLGETIREGTGPAAEAFKALGIDANRLSTLSPAERIREVGDALLRVQSEAQRGFLADEIFGGDAFKIMPLLSADLNQLTNDAQRFGAVVGSESVAAAQRYTQAMVRVKTILTGLGNAIAQGLAPVITSFANHFAEAGANINNNTGTLVSGFERLRESIVRVTTFLQVIAQNVKAVFEIVSLSIQLRMVQITNVIRGMFEGALTIVANFVKNTRDILLELFEWVRAGFRGGLEGLGQRINRVVSKGLLEGFDPKKVTKETAGYEKALKKRMLQIATGVTEQYQKKVNERLGDMKPLVQKQLKGIGDFDVNLGKQAGGEGQASITESRLLTRGRGSQLTMIELLKQVVKNTKKTAEQSPGESWQVEHVK